MQTHSPTTPTDIDRIMTERFATGTLRSMPYKLGVRAALESRLYGAPVDVCRFEPGHSDADAYYAGWAEGKAIARKVLEDLPA